MQEGEIENSGWSIYFDKTRNAINKLYHTREDRNRLCGTYCVNKSDVLLTHTDNKVIDKIYKQLVNTQNKHVNSKETLKKRNYIYALKAEMSNENRKVLDKVTADLKETMLEYFI